MKKRLFANIILAVLLFSFSVQVKAAWRIPIDNYLPQDYSAGTQNWQIVEHGSGWLYAANNYGLLEYDGSHWQVYGIWGGTVVRAIAEAPTGEMWVGGKDEFGYFTAGQRGEMQYVSLSESLQEKYQKFGEVWNICYLDGNLYIQTRHYIIKGVWSDKVLSVEERIATFSPEVYAADCQMFVMSVVNGGVYVGTNSGVYLFVGQNLNRLHGSEQLDGVEVRCLSEWENGEVLISTDLKGLYVYDGQTINRLVTDADAYIRKNQLYTAAICDNCIALGTVRGGVVTMDRQGHNCRYYGMRNGLLNNTILSLLFDKEGNLWAGLDKGISCLRLSSSVQHLMDADVDCGSGYTSAYWQGKLYLGTNQGLYVTNEQTTEALQIVEGSQGQVWNLCEVGSSLLCCHNRGLYEVEGMHLRPICLSDGFWTIRMWDADHVIAGSYNGLYWLERKGERWQFAWKIEGFEETALRYEIDGIGQIWAMSNGGVEKLNLSEDKKQLTAELICAYNAGHDWLTVQKVGEEVVICSRDYCGVVDAEGRLQEGGRLFDLLDGKDYYSLITDDKEGNVWYILGDKLKVRRQLQPNVYADRSELVMDGSGQFIGGFQHINFTDNGELIVGMVDGYSLVSYSGKDGQGVDEKHPVFIRRMVFRDGDREIVFGQSPLTGVREIELAYGVYSVQVECSGISITGKENLYSYRLSPKEKEFSPLTGRSEREYISLENGDYCLEVKAKNIETGEEYVAMCKFRILPPWYKTWWAKVIYIILGLGVGVFVGCFIFLLVTRSQRELEEKKNEEMRAQQEYFREEQHRQELRILQLEKSQAEFELKTKSQELGSLLLTQVNQKEWVEELQLHLRKLSESLRLKQLGAAREELEVLQEKLGQAKDSNVDWGRFEENFDIVNDQFLHKLSQRFPWMNKNERKLCAYIHMGLLTKEIAPLMHMTTRGVEMMRYRLRRKMGMEEQANMKEYFASLIVENE